MNFNIAAKGTLCALLMLATVAASARAAGQPGNEPQAEEQEPSPTEGVITAHFVDEATMQADLLQMLANSMQYAQGIWYNCVAPNSAGEECGYFKANSAGQNNEDGVRTNADFSMICAFLCKYAQGKVTLPQGVTWESVRQMAIKSLVFGYSTHKANRLKITSNNAYWGSVSNADHVWESSLWAMSLAYSSYFLRDELTDAQKECIYKMIKAECDYELERSIPTGFAGDTKAEENGWETNILACALGLYPDDELAPRWFDRLRSFAINCYSQADDAHNSNVVDPAYDNRTVSDLYLGRNLYDDYTLQNHNYFHTSYQNVVMQELGESHLALALFQGESPRWSTAALMHNNRRVMDEVLCRLALADGELAMPNGNDWSMFLYDQITSYTTAACFLRHPDALLLENLAYKNIKARQSTTPDGSWLLNSDIGPRRMGVEGHRVMMTWLMHHIASTATLQPSTWEQFNRRWQQAYLFPAQNIVRAATDQRFTVFSWSNGLRSYTGYFAPNSADRNKIVVPYKAHNTGNLLGWYSVGGKGTNATPQVSGIYSLRGNSYTMNGKLLTNDHTLENNFTLYSTPGNALIYIDYVVGRAADTITAEQGGLLAVSTDPFTRELRTLYHASGSLQGDGSQLQSFASPWVNIDNSVGVVNSTAGKSIAFGNRELNSSIYLSKLYTSYSDRPRAFAAGEVVDRRHIVYYSNVDAATTAQMSDGLVPLAHRLPQGWNGAIAADPDGAHYLLLSRYAGEDESCRLQEVRLPLGAPVFEEMTTLTAKGASATFCCDTDHSVANVLRVFAEADGLEACQLGCDSCAALLYNRGEKARQAHVTILKAGGEYTATLTVAPARCLMVKVERGAIAAYEMEIAPERARALPPRKE